MFRFFKKKKKDPITELGNRAIDNVNEAYKIKRDATQKLEALFASGGSREDIVSLLSIIRLMDAHIKTKDNKANR